jgi:tetratricopeptide (TPR) repeat protein
MSARALRHRPLGASLGLALLFAGTLGVGSLGCNDRDRADARPEPLPNGVVNEPLFAFLSKARAAHHEADLAEESGDRKRALAAMEKVTQGARPAMTPEVEEVLADAQARAADLLSKDGEYDAALAQIDAGLALAKTPTHFRGHLFEMRGVVEERRSKALRKAGDEAGADAAKERAIEAFQKAIDIQEAVIERALEGSGPAAPQPSASAPKR